jgi:hypothetical protein
VGNWKSSLDQFEWGERKSRNLIRVFFLAKKTFAIPGGYVFGESRSKFSGKKNLDDIRGVKMHI